MERAGDGTEWDGMRTWVAFMHLGGFYSPNPSIEAGHKAAQTPSVLVKARGEGGSLEGGRVMAGSALGKGFEPTDRGM